MKNQSLNYSIAKNIKCKFAKILASKLMIEV